MTSLTSRPPLNVLDISNQNPHLFGQLASTDSAFAALRADGAVIAWGDVKGRLAMEELMVLS